MELLIRHDLRIGSPTVKFIIKSIDSIIVFRDESGAFNLSTTTPPNSKYLSNCQSVTCRSYSRFCCLRSVWSRCTSVSALWLDWNWRSPALIRFSRVRRQRFVLRLPIDRKVTATICRSTQANYQTIPMI